MDYNALLIFRAKYYNTRRFASVGYHTHEGLPYPWLRHTRKKFSTSDRDTCDCDTCLQYLPESESPHTIRIHTIPSEPEPPRTIQSNTVPSESEPPHTIRNDTIPFESEQHHTL